MRMFKAFYKNEDGATSMEYALIVALIAMAILLSAGSMGTSLAGILESIADNIPEV